jgi:signal transduction histidine kinase/ActR/RegA family two-component response regulator
MRLGDFIEANLEAILVEFEAFARSIWPDGASVELSEARNDAQHILHATVADMRTVQTMAQQADKSKGAGRVRERRGVLGQPSISHGTARAVSGFDLWALIAEYRALRASVLRLWRASEPLPDVRDLDELTRFNESIDQSLTVAVHAYGVQVERDRQELLAREQVARTAAEHANRAKDLFLATLSHEMRTPLNAIVGWLSILQQEGVDAARVREGLKVIDRNTHAQVQLINDLLDVSRILSGKLGIDMRPCELSDVVAAGVEAVRPAADARGVTLSTSLPAGGAAASCDGPRIQQVVWNLAWNAVKFTPKGGRVDVSLRQEGSRMRIDVRDTGRGISADLLPHVFERFTQADSSTRRAVGGLGLGLSIVKYIVDAHGGMVHVHSDGDGMGATFIVWLPIQAVTALEARHEDGQADVSVGPERRDDGAAGATVARLDGVRVLVVEDEPDSRLALVMVLEQAGAQVHAAGTVDGALALLAEATPDVLVSDLGMPGRDGFDLIREVRGTGGPVAAVPAIALTALVQKDDAERALAAGFQRHVPKPVDPHRLTAVIATVKTRSDE